MEQKMSKIVTYKGKLPIGEQEKLHLSTNDGLTGYRIKKFQIMSAAPGTAEHELVAKIFLTNQQSAVTATVDFSDTDLLAAAISFSRQSALNSVTDQIVIDTETFNQDIFVTIADASGATVECNYYIELEKFSIDINTSTFHTLKNIRSRTQI